MGYSRPPLETPLRLRQRAVGRPAAAGPFHSASRRQVQGECGARRTTRVRSNANSTATDPFDGTVYRAPWWERLTSVVGSAANDVKARVCGQVDGNRAIVTHS